MYNDKLVYKVVIWVFWGVILWKEKEALKYEQMDPKKEQGNICVNYSIKELWNFTIDMMTGRCAYIAAIVFLNYYSIY